MRFWRCQNQVQWVTIAHMTGLYSYFLVFFCLTWVMFIYMDVERLRRSLLGSRSLLGMV